MKKNNEQVENQNALINILTPSGIKINPHDIEYGENYCKILGINKYAQSVDVGYLSKITNLQNSVVNIHYKPVDNSQLLNAINKQISQQSMNIQTSNDNIEIKRSQIAVENADKLLSKIESDNESVGLMDTTIMAIGSDKEELTKNTRKIQSNISATKCNSRSLPNLQGECLKHISPFYGKSTKIESIFGKVAPLSSFVGGFPFGTTGFNDGSGYYFAKDVYGSLMIVDIWKRLNDRVNTNMVITGKSGLGKSTFTKFLIANEFARNTKLLILDPEREYKDLCKNFKGDWLNVSGGESIINPLEILTPPEDDDDKDSLPSLAKHMETIEAFLKLYNREMSEKCFHYLKKKILELYENFNITFETDTTKLKSEDYPIFSDLYDLIEKDTKIKDDEKLKELAKDSLDIIFDICKGADKYLWNGHTSIDPKSNIIVFDTKDMQNATKEKKNTQYYNVLKYAWNYIEHNRSEKVLLFCDEAHLMIEKNVPQTLEFLKSCAKRIRKYGGGLLVITQDLIDFLAPEIKSSGQALLSNATYKVLFGTDGTNLQDEVEVFNLTEAERDLLEEQKRGHALFIAGNKKIHANFVLDEEFLKLMGTAGGK